MKKIAVVVLLLVSLVGAAVIRACDFETHTVTVECVDGMKVRTDVVGQWKFGPDGKQGTDDDVFEGSYTTTSVVGSCEEVPPPPVDVCPNIEGNQATIPDGMEMKDGDCMPIPPVSVDVCPNIDGDQSEIPSGYHMENGNCVKDQIVVTPDPTCPEVNCTPADPVFVCITFLKLEGGKIISAKTIDGDSVQIGGRLTILYGQGAEVTFRYTDGDLGTTMMVFETDKGKTLKVKNSRGDGVTFSDGSFQTNCFREDDPDTQANGGTTVYTQHVDQAVNVPCPPGKKA